VLPVDTNDNKTGNSSDYTTCHRKHTGIQTGATEELAFFIKLVSPNQNSLFFANTVREPYSF